MRANFCGADLTMSAGTPRSMPGTPHTPRHYAPEEQPHHTSLLDRVLSFVHLLPRASAELSERHSRISRAVSFDELPPPNRQSFGEVHAGRDRIAIRWKLETPPPPAPAPPKHGKLDPKSKHQFFHVFGGW